MTPRSRSAPAPDAQRPAHVPVSPAMAAYAKQLRREMTDAERVLWRHLRGHRFQALAFRRQVPMGRFIADFVCHAKGLVIELDGGQHAVAAVRDVARDHWFHARGYRVVRYWNSDVLGNVAAVLADLEREVARRSPALPVVPALVPPSPALPRKGGGGQDSPGPSVGSPQVDDPKSFFSDGAVAPPPPLRGRAGEGGMAASAAASGLVSTIAATGVPTSPDFPTPCRLCDGSDGLEA